MFLKILQVIPYFYPAWRYGGPVRVAYDMSKKLVEHGHSVVVYTSDIKSENARVDSSYKVVEGASVFYFKNLSTFTPRIKIFVTPSLLSAVKENIKSFDIVHIHGNRTSQNPILHYFLKKNSVPYVVQSHGGLPRIGMSKMKQVYDLLFGYRILRDASRVIALSEGEAQQYRSMGVLDEKIAVIPNGIDLSEYAVLPPKGSFKRKFGIKEEDKIVLYLGRLHKIKGIDILVKAFTNVIENLDDVRLVVVGPDDGYLSELQTLVKDMGIGNKVIFIGPLYGLEKIEAYVDSEVYVLPSRYETFPMTVLEAYACGKPVIASNVGGLKDLVLNGETGLLVEPGNKEQLAKSILYLLNDNCRAEGMGLKGKQLVEENFAINKVIAKLEKVYLEVAQSKVP